MKKRLNFSEGLFNVFNFVFLGLAVLICIYPLWYILVASFSKASAVTQGEVFLWVKGFNLEAYKKAFAQPFIGVSYINTVFYSVFGTLFSIALTILGGYALSKNRLRGGKFFTILVTFTTWFQAGLIPKYLLYSSLGLLDTRMAVILDGAVNTFNVIIMRSAFQGVPDSLEESMKIDGASDWQILKNVYLPLTVPTLMTLVLYYFVGRWNVYFWPMIVLSTETKVPLQVILRKLVVEMNGLFENADADITTLSKETIIYATMVIAVAPMLVVYPFIQKFFVKGITVGAVKG